MSHTFAGLFLLFLVPNLSASPLDRRSDPPLDGRCSTEHLVQPFWMTAQIPNDRPATDCWSLQTSEDIQTCHYISDYECFFFTYVLVDDGVLPQQERQRANDMYREPDCKGTVIGNAEKGHGLRGKGYKQDDENYNNDPQENRELSVAPGAKSLRCNRYASV